MRLLTILALTLSLLVQPVWAVVSVCQDMGGEASSSMDHTGHDMHHSMDQDMNHSDMAMMDCCDDPAVSCEMNTCGALSAVITSTPDIVSFLASQARFDIATEPSVHVAQSLFRPPIQH